MGLFSRQRQNAPAPSVSPGIRTIPRLYPEFYRAALAAAGKPVTDSNIAAVAGLTSANLALNAFRWLEVVGTPASRADWEANFTSDEPDPDIGSRPDRMIDWLWALNSRLHPGLGQFVGSMHETIVTSSQRFGDHLPANMWES